MPLFKEKALRWAQQFEEITWLDSNNPNLNKSEFNQSEFDSLLAVDSLSSLTTDKFEEIKSYQASTNDFIFGYFAYDLKNDIENLQSKNFDGIDFPNAHFFQPKRIISIKGEVANFFYIDESLIETDILEIEKTEVSKNSNSEKTTIQSRISKDEYLKKVSKALDYIHRGDIYEMNLCQEFYAENVTLDTAETYSKLNKISTPPFATFFKLKDKYLLSASPERFLKRKRKEVISQPIKGTVKRGLSLMEDLDLKKKLAQDPKEQSENIMIVDLVRNDLSKLANKGSVKVEELCKVYTFKQVHQLISTIRAEIDLDINSVDLIKSLFPMGSMTGAPKVSAMKIIEELEETKRGIYSGAVGYFTPNGNFDFNVVIRSIAYNATNKYISLSVGGAITAKSNPEREYEECLLKAKAMRDVL